MGSPESSLTRVVTKKNTPGSKAANTHPHLCISGAIPSFIPTILFCLFQFFLLADWLSLPLLLMMHNGHPIIPTIPELISPYISSSQARRKDEQHLEMLVSDF